MATAAVESMRGRRQLLRLAPPALLAVSVSGFWVYLGALDLIGVEPRTAITAAYYFLLGAAMTLFAWHGRAVIIRRVLASSRVPRVWALSAGLLAAWFLVNVALFSSGTVARDATGLLVLSSVPTALLALALTREQIRMLWGGLIGLGLGLAVVALVVLLAFPAQAVRFSPIDELDPISASRVTGLAAVLLVLWRPEERRAALVQVVGIAILIATTIVPGSRGAVLSLLFGLAVVAIALRRRMWPGRTAAIVAGLVLGVVGTAVVGSDYYYSVDVPGVEGRIRPPDQSVDFTGERTTSTDWEDPISSFGIRRHLLEKALRDFPDRPLLGHGVGMLVADGPDVERLVEAGRIEANPRTHPHNIVVESLYSLGLLGFALLFALLVTSAIALYRLLRQRRRYGYFALAFAAVAAANTSISGEIGSDVYLWLAVALPVALSADADDDASSM